MDLEVSLVSDSLSLVVAIAAAWAATGLALSIVMGRRGHNGFGWLVLGTLLGPSAVVLAVDARRHDEQLRPSPLPDRVPARAGTGPVDVLVGFDGSPESVAAVDAVVRLLGARLGRLTVATVVPYGDIVAEREHLASKGLRQVTWHTGRVAPELEVLHGRPAAALRQHAVEGGYELIAVGSRGAGITKAVIGSAASELARDGKVPVLVVGGDHATEVREAIDGQ